MTVITIDTKNKKDLAKAKALAKENGWLVKEPPQKTSPKKNGKKLVSLLNQFVLAGGQHSFPTNASAWQRKIRKDKKLSGR